MSNDREIRKSLYETKSVHLFLAIRRKKENKDIKEPEKIFRVVIREEEQDLQLLKQKCLLFKGVWRIYKTCNPRNVEKAQKMLMHKLLDEPNYWNYRIDSLWKTMLLQPQCKDGKSFLVDVDNKDDKLLKNITTDLINLCGDVDIKIIKETPNGYHFVVEKLDTRYINKEKYPQIDVIRDGYVFIDKIKVD